MSRSYELRVMSCELVVALAALVPLVLTANPSEIAKWDPAMGESRAVIDTNGVKWIDGRYFPSIHFTPFVSVTACFCAMFGSHFAISDWLAERARGARAAKATANSQLATRNS